MASQGSHSSHLTLALATPQHMVSTLFAIHAALPDERTLTECAVGADTALSMVPLAMPLVGCPPDGRGGGDGEGRGRGEER